MVGRVDESYLQGTDRETLLNSYSLVKSLVGVLVLKAHVDGRMPWLDAIVSDTVPGAPLPIDACTRGRWIGCWSRGF